MSPDDASGPTRASRTPAGPVPVGPLAAVAVAWLATACGGEAPSADVTVRDSAGVTIVEHPEGVVEAAPRWKVDPDPELDVGTVDGEPAHQFSQILDAVTLSDGTVVVAHNDPPELRFYDADGTHLRTAGGEGEGPGEFQVLGELLRLAGDTLLAYDWRLHRLSRFAPDGSFVDDRRVDAGPGAQVVGRLSDGTLVGRGALVAGSDGPPEEGTFRRPSVLLAYHSDGSVRDTVALREGRARHVQSRGQAYMMISVPLAAGPHEAVGPDAVYSGHGRRWEIRELDAGGDVRRVIRLDRERRPLTEDVWEERVAAWLDGIDDSDRRGRQEEMYAAMERPDRLPAFDEMLLDGEGHLWVREAGSAAPADVGDVDRWLVFSPEGRLRAVALVPDGLRLLEVGRERVVASWTDELDVPHLRVHRLDRGGSGASG